MSAKDDLEAAQAERLRRGSQSELLIALRAAVAEIEKKAAHHRARGTMNIDRATGVDDALEILDRCLGPWLGEEGA